jgi:methionyl aminopeptidase
MEAEVLENYKKALKISDDVIIFARDIVGKEASILKIGEAIEQKIKSLGAKPAFPVNISINEDAAHYTPDINDTILLKQDDLVKIDIGLHINGYISDRAFTVCIGSKSHPLIEASEKGLQAALKLIKPGTKIFEISEVVENTIKELGFNPVHNLCGHGLDQYSQHASPTIPNGKNNISEELIEGEAIAMEVFATDGVGMVKESTPILIYKFRDNRAVRMMEGRKILEKSVKEFDLLPFTKRWLTDVGSALKIDMALKQLVDAGALIEYPLLKEETKGLVAQTEETVII